MCRNVMTRSAVTVWLAMRRLPHSQSRACKPPLRNPVSSAHRRLSRTLPTAACSLTTEGL